MTFAPVLTPHGTLTLEPADDALELPRETRARLERSFARSAGHGLLSLGADDVETALPPVLAYWRDLGARYIATLCALPEIGENAERRVAPPAQPELERMAAAVPPMLGGEYLTADVLGALWRGIDEALHVELAEARLPIQDFLKARHPAWNLVGRVHFNLAENRKDDEAPFAFMATYTTRLTAAAKAQHVPLGKALQEYAGANNRQRLLSLLMPVHRAAERCSWLKAMVDNGVIFHPLRWTPAQAFAFLKDVAALESAGVIVRMPATWRMNRPSRPMVKATVGGNAPSRLGLDALLDFKMEISLDGEKLSPAEIGRLLAQSDGLAFVRGRWIEVDRERLGKTIAQFEEVQRMAASDGVSFAEAMRMVSGAEAADSGFDRTGTSAWGETVAGPWLAETLAALRQPENLARIDPGGALTGTLRPYQRAGLQWLHLLSRLGLGACLADDMGLGKTIQVLALLLVLKNESPTTRKPSLLVVPASLLANWTGEIARFAPHLATRTVHPSGGAGAETIGADDLAKFDLVITTYGYLARTPLLTTTAWRLAVLDEAQAIKNPGAKQTRTVKQIDADARIALTGTPIENRLGDLWSIFDFINPGLLGSAKQFSTFVKNLGERPHNPFGPLRELVRPYILRRMKTDKSIISDLPDKSELKTFCGLSRKQAALYRQAVDELSDGLEGADGIQRKGIVLAFLMRFKQICNHPSQWLRDDAWLEQDSGKFARLREIAETIATRQEKALIFTQFREMTGPLASFLGSVFGRSGLVLHGGTEVGKRKDLVRRFQEDERVPFFVLSLKAGGAGLNLTAATHVVHFDRWWNPAVENQATDRAFRIGQTRNVLVHKFICRGTVEDKIDGMIEAKRQTADEILGGGADKLLTEMTNDELLKFVALDLRAALQE